MERFWPRPGGHLNHQQTAHFVVFEQEFHFDRCGASRFRWKAFDRKSCHIIFPNEAPNDPSPNLAAMRVRDLLTMTAGHQTEVNLRRSNDWVRGFLNHDVPHKPGTHFQYKTPATFMQYAIVQQVTGQTVRDYLDSHLFQPLRIETPTWNESPNGISIGGYGLYLRTEDIAKFGQLFLQRGIWQEEQTVPSEWVKMATSKQVSNGTNPNSDWNQGYGFQF